MIHELTGLTWLTHLETQNTNYNHLTFDRLKDAPKRWLASLPMFEYAHVCTVVTALRCGGDPEKFVEVLYKEKMNPVLKEYYDYLAHYRLMRALYMRKYDPTMDKLKESSLTQEVEKMKCFARKTRAKLREICKKYEESIYGKNSSTQAV